MMMGEMSGATEPPSPSSGVLWEHADEDGDRVTIAPGIGSGDPDVLLSTGHEEGEGVWLSPGARASLAAFLLEHDGEPPSPDGLVQLREWADRQSDAIYHEDNRLAAVYAEVVERIDALAAAASPSYVETGEERVPLMRCLDGWVVVSAGVARDLARRGVIRWFVPERPASAPLDGLGGTKLLFVSPREDAQMGARSRPWFWATTGSLDPRVGHDDWEVRELHEPADGLGGEGEAVSLSKALHEAAEEFARALSADEFDRAHQAYERAGEPDEDDLFREWTDQQMAEFRRKAHLAGLRAFAEHVMAERWEELWESWSDSVVGAINAVLDPPAVPVPPSPREPVATYQPRRRTEAETRALVRKSLAHASRPVDPVPPSPEEGEDRAEIIRRRLALGNQHWTTDDVRDLLAALAAAPSSPPESERVTFAVGDAVSLLNAARPHMPADVLSRWDWNARVAAIAKHGDVGPASASPDTDPKTEGR